MLKCYVYDGVLAGMWLEIGYGGVSGIGYWVEEEFGGVGGSVWGGWKGGVKNRGRH